MGRLFRRLFADSSHACLNCPNRPTRPAGRSLCPVGLQMPRCLPAAARNAKVGTLPKPLRVPRLPQTPACRSPTRPCSAQTPVCDKPSPFHLSSFITHHSSLHMRVARRAKQAPAAVSSVETRPAIFSSPRSKKSEKFFPIFLPFSICFTSECGLNCILLRRRQSRAGLLITCQ